MPITVKHTKVSTIPDDADTSLVRPSDWNADHALTGVIDVTNGGTGASTLTGYVKGNGTSAMTAVATVPSTDITGLGTMSTQNANAVAITGGTINNTTIGATTRAAGSFTDLTTTNAPTFGAALPIASGGTGATGATGAMANLIGFTSTATAAGTTTLTNASTYFQLFTGTLAQTVVLPVTSTLQTGWAFKISNNSSGSITVQSSGGNTVLTIGSGLAAMFTCIGTTLTTAADWEGGYTDFSTRTGEGSAVLSISPSISGTLTLTAAINANTNTATLALGTAQTTGVWSAGGASGTGTMTLGQSTLSQTTNIQSGITASGSTKTINFGANGAAGSTTNITIGSTTGTSTTTFNGITKQQNYTVTGLPSASTSGVGARAFVTDALAPAFGSTVVTGGAVAVPVYSDGTNWKVG
jgi:hypothetical protein